METIKVHVCRQKGRTNLAMRYVDPDTGKQVWRTTGTANQTKALKAAAVWESELREGRYNRPSKITWQEFRHQYDVAVLDGMKATTAANYSATLNVFERKMKPNRLAEVTTAKLTEFIMAVREDYITPASVARHIRQLKVALRWAHRNGLLTKLPEFTMPKVPKGMKGRPLVAEEFERMLAAAPHLDFYLRGLWLSGLRLGESMALRWDDAPGAILVDFSGRRPMFRIPAESEKGNTHRILPMAPEFAQLLETVPAAQRRGYVFRFPEGTPRTLYAACRMFAAVGESAGVKIKERTRKGADGKPETVPQFATAHDLRRSFGFRWSRRVMPTVLRELMRHESIETTMRFYVGQNAEATADELWRAVENEAVQVAV
jgi:integrase